MLLFKIYIYILNYSPILTYPFALYLSYFKQGVFLLHPCIFLPPFLVINEQDKIIFKLHGLLDIQTLAILGMESSKIELCKSLNRLHTTELVGFKLINQNTPSWVLFLKLAYSMRFVFQLERIFLVVMEDDVIEIFLEVRPSYAPSIPSHSREITFGEGIHEGGGWRVRLGWYKASPYEARRWFGEERWKSNYHMSLVHRCLSGLMELESHEFCVFI